ncbi:uncharacterized protein MELLADRAFT_115623 [Melampsora larici-populina 98AG31]|uniref:Uncharacterized protein n=1 Tax=Melampsora larici-populina (strain 98AG31 / pathotype 3-4-7) TaxID=747676 RepID=F4RCD3_MELLP|nr:uncharacterized protein MELLADRAFT_115623 [Melampsora larici-populina 98AG31]EGG09980.1 hypothetical protein MELLADRAFT_115623 [Melampsora larici-populina 98AG31]
MQTLTRPIEAEPDSQPEYPDFRPPQPEAIGYRTMPYFGLCRKIGVNAVDEMIRGRILDLRWTRCVNPDVGDHPGERNAVMPAVLPTSPVMRCAMKKVIDEYLSK